MNFEKTVVVDLFVDAKTRSTDTNAASDINHEFKHSRDKERLEEPGGTKMAEQASEVEGSDQVTEVREIEEKHYWPTGERFIDYMAYEAGLLKLSDIINL